MLYYMHEQHLFMCTLQLKSSPTAYAQYTHDYCSISLFAETILHIGQVPMLVYIKNFAWEDESEKVFYTVKGEVWRDFSLVN